MIIRVNTVHGTKLQEIINYTGRSYQQYHINSPCDGGYFINLTEHSA